MTSIDALGKILPFGRKSDAGCGFLKDREIDAYLDGRLASRRRDAFDRHSHGGCLRCCLLAADLRSFGGLLVDGPLPAEQRAFDATRAIVAARLRQEVEASTADRRARRFGVSWKPLVGIAAAAMLMAVVFVPREGSEPGLLQLPGGAEYRPEAMPFSAPPAMRGGVTLGDLWNRAGVAYQAGDFEQAATELSAIRSLDPASHDAALYQGVALTMGGRHDEALEPLQTAIEIGEAAGLSLASERYFLGVAALGAGDESLARLALGASAAAGGSWGERSAELLERLDGAE
jgi:tetratricopeptide (TPR) repeat protein